jgi:hypothetical protein
LGIPGWWYEESEEVGVVRGGKDMWMRVPDRKIPASKQIAACDERGAA